MNPKLVLPFMLITLLGGCATVKLGVSNSAKPWESVTVDGQSGASPINGFIGSTVCKFDSQPIKGCTTKLEFMPGKNTLVIQSSQYGSVKASDTVTKNFKAGEHYLLALEFSADGIYPVMLLVKVVKPPNPPI